MSYIRAHSAPTLHTDVSIVSVSNPELTAKTATLLVNVRLNSLRGCNAISTNSLDPGCDVNNLDAREEILREKLAFLATSLDVVALLQSQNVARLAKVEEKLNQEQAKFSQGQASTSGGRKGDAPPGSKTSAEQEDNASVSGTRPARVYPSLPPECPTLAAIKAAGRNPNSNTGPVCFVFAENKYACRRRDDCPFLHSWPPGVNDAEKKAYIRYIGECTAFFRQRS